MGLNVDRNDMLHSHALQLNCMATLGKCVRQKIENKLRLGLTVTGI